MPPTPSRRPRWRTWSRRAGTGYGLLATAAVLVVLVSSDAHAVSYVLGLFASWWLAPALVLVPLAAASASWRALAALSVPAVVAGGLVGPYALNRLTPADRTADLRVATFNTSSAAGAEGLRALLEQARPDVVALQEVADWQLAGLARSHPRYPYSSHDGGGPRTGGDGLVLSRWPVVEVRPVTGLPAGARPADVVVVDVDGRRLAVLSVHLASPCLFCSERGLRRNPAGDTGSAARVRVAEARRYGEVARQLRAEGNAVVLAGDLNSSDLNEPLRSLTRSGLTDVHRAVGTRPQLTRGSSPGFARVDVVLVSGLVPLADSELDPGGSTHSPVVAELAWP